MKSIAQDRLIYLAERFDVFEDDSDSVVMVKLQSLKDEGFETHLIEGGRKSKILAIVSSKKIDDVKTLKKVSVSQDVFTNMLGADPTDNKIYLQWMLNVFTRFIKEEKEESIAQAIRFAVEDLPQASTYLMLYEGNKRKIKFIDLCKNSFGLKHITDPSDINQFRNLSQLFDAVDPFVEREPSAVERTMEKFVQAGQALIPVKDRKFTLFIPKTTEANVIFDNFANWCTAKKGNGMFKSYTEGSRKPNGKNSDIYIVINNKFFTGESEEIYQIHFETNQLKDRKNSSNVNIYDNVISVSDALRDYFHDELMTMAKDYTKGIDGNRYLDFLIKFGFAESLFEMLSEDTPSIRIMKREIPKLPDLSRFKNVDQFIITDAELVEIHPSLGNLVTLEILSLPNNKIKSLPKEIGNLKNLELLNLVDNKIEHFPEEIKNLDKSNGGSLLRLCVKETDIGSENFNKLKRLLPQTEIIAVN
jgi:Leucine-rich repeat (LRR) protein